MADVKTQSGVMEAFSFRKGVVKISGQWIRFGKELEGSIRGLSVGDSVSYVVEDRNLKRIEKVQPQAAGPKPATAMPAAPTADSRNRSIERQVALKAAVELADLFGYKTTNQCLDVAASFADWIGASGAGRSAADDPVAFLS